MNAKNQAAYDQLEKIKGTLLKIRDSDLIQNVEADSDVAKGLAGVFGGVSDVLTQNSKGIASSKGARNAVTNGESVVNTGGNSAMDAMTQLRQQNQKLQKAFEVEKSTREGLESDKSIGDQKTNQELQDIIANMQAGGTGGAGGATGTETGTGAGAAGGTAPDGSANTPAGGTVDGGINTENDPVAMALSEDYNNQQAVVKQQLQALSAFVDAEDDDTQAALNNIQATADLQSKRVAKENERLAQASQVAGIVSGRGMYSPYEHEGIVSEVIQDGLDRITQIELTAQDAKLEAKKAHREFRYEAFVQSTEMVSALSELKRQTVVDIGKRLQEVEAAEREKMTFDQEQQDRTSFILAAELVDATPEEIRAAALANGVNAGALMRTVADYKNEQEGIELDRELTEEQILTQRNNRSVANARLAMDRAAAARAADDKKDEEDKEETLDIDAVNEFTEAYDLTDDTGKTVIGTDWTEADVEGFREMFPNAPKAELKNLAQTFKDEQKAQDEIVQEILDDDDIDLDNLNIEEEIENRMRDKGVGESTEEKTTRVKQILMEGQKTFGKGSMAGAASSDPIWGFIPNPSDQAIIASRGKKDAERWLATQEDEIARLAGEGYEVYEIISMLMRDAGETNTQK